MASMAASRSVWPLPSALCPVPFAMTGSPSSLMNHCDGCQEDDGIVAAPAVRVLVRERGAMPQAAALLEGFLDIRVRVEHALARKQADRIVEMPAGPHRRVDIEAVLEPRGEVVGSVARSGVHCARPGVERHVAGQHADRIAVVERVAEPDAFELRALHARDGRVERAADGLRHRRRELFREQHGAAVHLVRRVVEVRMKRDGQVRRDRPRGRRPDQDGHVATGKRRHARAEFARARRRKRELHVDRRRRVILVLDFRLGERRAAVDAPVHGLLALGDEPLLDEPPEGARDRRLVPEVHREVRLIPRPEDAQPLELFRHGAHEPLGVRAAGAAEIRDRHVALLRTELPVDLQLDRQAMAVVADDVGRVEPGHRP